MNKVKIGIIGCGGIAFGKHLPALSRIDAVELVAFCDITEERAAKAASDFGCCGAKVFTDYRELISLKEIDAVHICTPNREHSFMTVEALEAGKHVMCEKPMAKTAAEARKMLDAARKTGKKLTIGYQNRHTPAAQYLKKCCENGELGDIYFAKAHAIRRRGVPTWGVFLNEEEQGGGPLIDIGTHALDLTLWMMDNYKALSVTGSSYRKLAEQKNTANPWGDWDPKKYTVEDSAFGYIKMENGATIFLESAWALNTLDVKEARCTLCGTKGGADMDSGLRINGVKNGRQFTEIPTLSGGGVDFYEGSIDSPADREASAWIDSIIKDEPPLVLPEQALVVTEILESIYKSAKTGKTVIVGNQ